MPTLWQTHTPTQCASEQQYLRGKQPELADFYRFRSNASNMNASRCTLIHSSDSMLCLFYYLKLKTCASIQSEMWFAHMLFILSFPLKIELKIALQRTPFTSGFQDKHPRHTMQAMGDSHLRYVLESENIVMCPVRFVHNNNCPGEGQQQLQTTDNSAHQRGCPTSTNPQRSVSSKNLVLGPRWVSTKRQKSRLTVGWRECQLMSAEYQVGVEWSPACKEVSPESEELPSLGAATKQSEWEN
jgi:hypothetical protein